MASRRRAGRSRIGLTHELPTARWRNAIASSLQSGTAVEVRGLEWSGIGAWRRSMALIVILFVIMRKPAGGTRFLRRAALRGLNRSLGGYGHQARTVAGATATSHAAAGVAISR